MPKIHKGQKGRKDLIMMEPEALKIVDDENDPRFDPRSRRPIDEAMVASIMQFGVVQALTIYSDGDDVYVSMGHQRRINAVEANKRLKKEGRPTILVPCVWRKDDDVTLFAVRQVENNIRSGDRLLERARAMQRLINMGGSTKDVALAFGCTEQSVRNALALLDCDVKVQRAVESGQVAAGVATTLAKLTREEQRARLDKMVADGVTKGRKAKEAAKTGRTDVKVTKMLSRAFLERWREELAAGVVEGDRLGAALVRQVLDAVLGRAELGQVMLASVREAAERARTPKKPQANGHDTETQEGADA